MKKLNYTSYFIGTIMIFVSSCSNNDEFKNLNSVCEEGIIHVLSDYNESLQDSLKTRGNGPAVLDVEDATLEIVEADLIGAFEGAIKASNHSTAFHTMRLFINAITNNGKNLFDYYNIANIYLRTILKSKELIPFEKEGLYMGIIVGLYSMSLWSCTPIDTLN